MKNTDLIRVNKIPTFKYFNDFYRPKVHDNLQCNKRILSYYGNHLKIHLIKNKIIKSILVYQCFN
jgi:hypothetical protein